jgi:hypothetical protein
MQQGCVLVVYGVMSYDDGVFLVPLWRHVFDDDARVQRRGI